MAHITTQAANVWTATYNRQAWRIVRNQQALDIYRLENQQTVKVDKAPGLLRLWRWHVQSKRQESELPVLFAVVDGMKHEE